MNAENPSVSGPHYIWGICEFFFAAIRRWFLLLLVAPLLAAAVGYAATFALKPVYLGYLTMRCGRVAGAPVQTVQFMIDRIGSPTFTSSVLSAQHRDIGKDQTANLTYQSLAARALAPSDPTPDAIEVSLRGYNKDEMTATLQAIADLVGQQQAEIAQPRIESLKARLAQAEADIARLSAEKKGLMDTLTRTPTPPPPPPAKTSSKTAKVDAPGPTAAQLQLRQMIEDTDKAIGKVSQERIELTNDVSPQRTFGARMLDQVFVSPAPIYPMRLYLATLVGTGVFVLCLFFALTKAPTRREVG